MVIITGVILANLKQGAKNDNLRLGASELATICRKVQNLSLIGSEQSLPPGVLNNNGIFGIHFDLNRETEYRLFLDFKNEAEENAPDGKYQTGEELPNAVYFLPRDIIVSGLTPQENNVLDITFQPPKPVIYFNGLNEEASSEIVLVHASTNKTRRIIINRVSGQISIIE
ncbi:MAG: hypothetical protein V1692_01010 [bacterium]